MFVLFIPQKSYASFSPAVLYDVGNNPRSVFAADLDGNSNLDLAVANYTSNTVSVLLSNGAGTYAATVNYAVGSRPSTVFAADLDDDGDRDLVVANFLSDNVSVLLNNGSGTFAAAVNYAAGDGAWGVFARDLDGDSDLDLAVTNSNAATISILLNNGNGIFAASVNYAVQSVPSSVHAVDFDGDGDADLAVANYFGATVSLLLNNGNGTYAAAVHYEVGNWSTSQFNYPIALYAADLDGDDDFDIATANYDNNQISVLLNNGNGTFGASVEYAVGSRPPSVIAADIDGDGDKDLVTANYFGGTVSILFNNGNGTFAAALDYAAGSGPWSVFAADLDGDSDLDLAVTNYDNAKVSSLLSDVYAAAPPATPSGTTPGATLNVVKMVVNDNGQTNIVADFPLFVNGTPVTSGVTYSFPLTGMPYVVTETSNPNYTRTFSGDCDVNGNAFLLPGDQKFCIITNNDIGPPPAPIIPPIIDVVKVPNPLALPAGPGPVTYTYTVRNIGTVPMTNVMLVGDTCSPIVLQSGDTNGNNVLEVSETWVHTCTTTLTATHTNTIVAIGLANGIVAVDMTRTTVVVGTPIVPPIVPEPRYSVAEQLAAVPTINADKGLSASFPGAPVHCVSGTLIKLPNDGDPMTQIDSAVYYCGADGKRYVFPDAGTYHSWYQDFSGVVIVSAAELAAAPVGGNVTYRPGSRMIKFQTDPNVYAVAKGGVLRWVPSEVVAKELYGLLWNDLIGEISDAFFGDYTVGAPITSADVIPGFVPAPGCTTITRFNMFLSLESTDPQVRQLQELLQCLGFFPADIAPTGYFGAVTEDAVKRFQSANGITATGYVGPATRDALNRYAAG